MRQKRAAYYRGRIQRDPRICRGTPVIKGTRVPVRTILASLAEGATIEQILDDFPTLTERDILIEDELRVRRPCRPETQEPREMPRLRSA